MKFTNFFLLCVAILLFHACQQTYYIPNGLHVPMFTEEGQTSVAGRLNGGLYHTGGELQFARSTSDRRAIMGTANFNSLERGGGGANLALGYGSFKPLNRFIVLEAYGGLSYGTMKNYYSSPSDTLQQGGILISLPYETTSRVHHLGAWVQPQIGFTTRFADIGLVSRFHYMSFIAVSQRGDFWPSDQQELFYLRANKGNLFWEPGLVFRFGWDYVKAEIQYVASVNMFNENLNYEPLRAGLGLTFLLPPKKK